jgi:hypothetical protein
MRPPPFGINVTLVPLEGLNVTFKPNGGTEWRTAGQRVVTRSEATAVVATSSYCLWVSGIDT